MVGRVGSHVSLRQQAQVERFSSEPQSVERDGQVRIVDEAVRLHVSGEWVNVRRLILDSGG